MPRSGQPLPPVERAGLAGLPNALSAYNICLELESNTTTEEGLMHARILGYLILHTPSSDSSALAEVVLAIHSCARDEKKLEELGECFRLWFIRPFKKYKGRTPATADHPSRPSFNQVREALKARIQQAPRDHKEAKAKALVRDGYKCVVTGKYDEIAEIDHIADIPVILAAGGVVNTELAHIIPQSTYFDVYTPSDEKDYSTSVLAVFQRFGYDTTWSDGEKVHSLYNVMTMEKNVHGWFDRLSLWFESTGVANQYRVRTNRETISLQLPAKVTFTSPDPVNFPYPSSKLLELHATCAKVAHFSGAGEYIDKFDRDADGLDVLEADGSSSAILAHALFKSMLRPLDTAARDRCLTIPNS